MLWESLARLLLGLGARPLPPPPALELRPGTKASQFTGRSQALNQRRCRPLSAYPLARRQYARGRICSFAKQSDQAALPTRPTPSPVAEMPSDSCPYALERVPVLLRAAGLFSWRYVGRLSAASNLLFCDFSPFGIRCTVRTDGHTSSIESLW